MKKRFCCRTILKSNTKKTISERIFKSKMSFLHCDLEFNRCCIPMIMYWLWSNGLRHWMKIIAYLLDVNKERNRTLRLNYSNIKSNRTFFDGFWWVLVGFDGFRWVLVGFGGFWGVLMGFGGFWWVLMRFYGFLWVLMGFDGFWWVLMGSDGFWWVLMGSDGVWKRFDVFLPWLAD